MGKIMLNGIDYTAPSASGVAGVKGNSENSYRTGYVNLTPANIGALSINGTAANSSKLQNLPISRWNGIPQIKNDGVMEIGKCIDFHISASNTSDYAARILAETSGLTLTGTTKGTFVSENNFDEEADEYEIHRSTVNENSINVSTCIKCNDTSEDNMGDIYSSNYVIENNTILTDSELSLKTVRKNTDYTGETTSSYNETIYKNGQIDCSDNFSVKAIEFSTNVLRPSYSTASNTDLGASDYKWRNIYATNGTIQTSDRTRKSDIEALTGDKTKEFIMGLTPVSYKMTDGTSGRTHYGLIAQDIENLMAELDMDSKDFAGFIKSPKVITRNMDENGCPLNKPIEEIVEGEYDYSLRYDEFIAPLIKTVQNQQKEIEELRMELVCMKSSKNS